MQNVYLTMHLKGIKGRGNDVIMISKVKRIIFKNIKPYVNTNIYQTLQFYKVYLYDDRQV